MEVCHEIFAPPPQLTVSEWADANRILPKHSGQQGRFQTSRIPYMRKIQDALGDDRIREVVLAKSAQIAGSTIGENWIGFLMDQEPCAILSLWPTDKKLRDWSSTRLAPMLEQTLCLAAKFPQSARRDSRNSLRYKEFSGGYLRLLTARSTAELRSAAARAGIVEELDDFDANVRDQGDPLELFRTRLRTFWNSKLFILSTPTVEGFSRVWMELSASTWNQYWVPCPYCDHRQLLQWKDEAGAYRIICDKDESGALLPETARFLCGGCGVLIEERMKMAMLEDGAWVPRFPGRYVEGFQINSLYSPLCTWADVIRAFVRAEHSSAMMQVFDNNWLGLPYRLTGEQVEGHFLAARVESYPPAAVDEFALPEGVGLVTAGVDVQGDRLECFLWGWGHLEEAWVYRWLILPGDPGQDQVWRDLDQQLLHPWPHAGGASLRVAAAAIDAGYQSERVVRFCEARLGRGIIATVGRAGRGRPLLMAPEPMRYKPGPKRKRPMYVIGVDSGKDMLASRLKLTLREDGTAPPGYVHFPEAIDRVFFDQLTAERLITVYPKTGDRRPRREWRIIEGRRNEALDGAVLAMAALAHLGGGVIRRLGELAKQVAERGKLGQDAPPAAPSGRRVRSQGIDW